MARAIDGAFLSHETPEIIAVAKRQPLDRIVAALKAGQRVIGENRIEEAEERWPDLKPDYPDLELHFIGTIQSRKLARIVALFDVIHTLDRSSLIPKLARVFEQTGRSLPCFIQVNTGDEPQKGGCAPADLGALLAEAGQAGIQIRGLMCLPPKEDDPALHFALLKKLADQHGLQELSIGMSGDYELAAAFGARYVRIGTGVFGPRIE